MQISQKSIIIFVSILIVALSITYVLISDLGLEKILTQTKEISPSCETIAEKQARQDLKLKYGDVLSKDFVLGSPHYKNRYNLCLGEKEK